jgi:DNA-binding NarL/FixJ family response regulator
MKILIADDHALFREGLHYTLKALDNDVEILEAANGSQAIQIVRHYPDLDLVLMDLDMPGLDGYQGLTQLRQNYPELPVVIVTASEYEQDMIRVMKCGASGYIPKSMTSKDMLEAIGKILNGDVFVPDLSVTSGTFHIRQGTEQGARATIPPPALDKFQLTPRQREVLLLMCQGLSNKGIANQLGMAEGTVKIHVTAILKAMNAGNRTQAVIMAREAGLGTNSH